MKNPEDLCRELTLSSDIVELIGRVGPMHSEDIASRLGVASRHRYKEAVKHLLSIGQAERFASSKPGLRLVGDTRPTPASTLHQLTTRRRRIRRAQRVQP